MRLLRHIQVQDATCLPVDTVATIGNFDGVHCGHQALLQALKREAHRQHLPTLVVLFEPQPHEYFQSTPEPAVISTRLTSLTEKWRMLATMNIDYVCCLRFNQSLAAMSADDFAEEIIFSRLRVKQLFIGEDFRFGAGRAGNIKLLEKTASNAGAALKIYPEVKSGNNRISSTRIRKMLKQGMLDEAKMLLGRSYSLYGRVVMGEQLGRTFGVPTANIQLRQRALPMTGVFCVTVKRSNGGTYQGVANLGRRPTIDGLSNRLEVHVFDFEGSLYHEHLEVFFLHRLRDEVKFPSFEALIQQIKADVVEARAFFDI